MQIVQYCRANIVTWAYKENNKMTKTTLIKLNPP